MRYDALQFQVQFDEDETASLATMSNALRTRSIRFHSLVSLYRRSYTDVERAATFVEVFDEEKPQ